MHTASLRVLSQPPEGSIPLLPPHPRLSPESQKKPTVPCTCVNTGTRLSACTPMRVGTLYDPAASATLLQRTRDCDESDSMVDREDSAVVGEAMSRS